MMLVFGSTGRIRRVKKITGFNDHSRYVIRGLEFALPSTTNVDLALLWTLQEILKPDDLLIIANKSSMMLQWATDSYDFFFVSRAVA